MSAGLRGSADGLSAFLQVAGIDVVKVDLSGVMTLSKAPIIPAALQPIFRVTKTSASGTASANYVKVSWPTVGVDTAGGFSTANNRYQPNVAGWYQVSAGLSFIPDSGTLTYIVVNLYKNGASYRVLQELTGTLGGIVSTGGTALVYMNGTTDYIEIYAYAQSSGGAGISVGGNNPQTVFEGAYVRP